MGAERKTTFISDEVKKMTAYHEVRSCHVRGWLRRCIDRRVHREAMPL